jgi:hypothetical protein
MRKPERSAELASDSSPADLLDDGLTGSYNLKLRLVLFNSEGAGIAAACSLIED